MVPEPFPTPLVKDHVTGYTRLGTPPATTAAGDPEIAFGEVVSRLRDSGVPAGAQRLAVVVSKADLLSAAGLELPGGSEEIANWLLQLGQHNTVLAAGRDFAQVRFFALTVQGA